MKIPVALMVFALVHVGYPSTLTESEASVKNVACVVTHVWMMARHAIVSNLKVLKIYKQINRNKSLVIQGGSHCHSSDYFL